MKNRSLFIVISIILFALFLVVIYKTQVVVPEVDMSDINNGPANILPISIDVETNQAGRKVLLVKSGSLALTGTAPGTMFFEGSFPIYFEDEFGATVAQGLATAKGDWMTTNKVPFMAVLKVKPITKPVIGNIVFTRDNPSGLPEHDFELKLPAVLQNK